MLLEIYLVTLNSLFILLNAFFSSISELTSEVSQPDSPRASWTINGAPSDSSHTLNSLLMSLGIVSKERLLFSVINIF